MIVRRCDTSCTQRVEGTTIGTRRTTSGKRDREAAKKNRAAAKRERRAARAVNDTSALPAAHETASAEELLQQLKRLHDDFDANVIDFDAFDARKQDLLARITSSLAVDERTQTSPVEE